MKSTTLQKEATDLVNALGDCAISVRLIVTVFADVDRASNIARWLLAEQESYQKKIDRLDARDEYINETIWLIYLLDISGYGRKAFLTARSFLSELAEMDISDVSSSLRSGIDLAALVYKKNDNSSTNDLINIDLSSILAAAVEEDVSDASLESEFHSYFQKSEDGAYPVLWDTWRPAFLLMKTGAHDG